MDDTNAAPEVPSDAPGDLRLDDEAAEQVVGGETAQATTAYRGRYQLKLNEANKALGG